MEVKKESVMQAPADAMGAGMLLVSNDVSMTQTVEELLLVLLNINTAIATIRERKELFAAILDQIKPLIPVDDTGVLVLDKTGTRWQDWTNVDNYQDTPAAAHLQQLGYDKFQPLDRWLEYTLNHSGIMTVARFREQYPEHPFGAVMWEAGLKEFIFTPLVNGGKKLGVLFFDSEREGTYTEGHLAIFKAIADQVAVAVANILASEEILEREREKSVLLSISGAISSARDAVELLSVIREKAQQLIPFYDTGVLIVEDDGQHHYDLSVNIQGWDPSESNKQLHEAGLFRVRHPDSYVAYVMYLIEKARGPIIEDWEGRYEEFDHPFFPICKSLGFKEAMTTHLKLGGKTFGTLWLNAKEKNHFHPKQFEIFQSLADQVAVAVANILANEEILEREREKALLLSLSEDMATIRDRDDLWRVMTEKVKQLLPFEESPQAFVLDPEGKQLKVLLIDPSREATQTEEYQAHIGPWFAFEEKPFQDALRAVSPTLFTYEYFQERYPDYWGTRIWQQVGIKEMLSVQLTYGGRLIGLFNLLSRRVNSFPPTRFALFKSIADQVAVAVANILANEEILEREREKTALLRIAEAIARIQNRKELLRVIYDTIQPVYPFDNAGLFVANVEKDLFYELLDRETFPDEIQSQLTEENQLGPFPLSLSSPESWWMQEGTVINSMLQEASYAAGTPYERQFEVGLQHGLKHMIGGPLFANGKKIGALCFNAGQEDFFADTSRYLFKSISDQIGVAIANILANEEILEREREKSTLLSVSAAIAKVQDRSQLLKAIYQKITPLFSHRDIGLFVVDEENDEHWEILDESVLDEDFSQIAWQKFGRGPFKHQGSGVDLLMNGPVILSIEELNTCTHPYIPVMKEIGLKEFLGGPLLVNSKKRGMFSFNADRANTYSERDYPLFQGILDQLSVALANILANEESLKREREKSLQITLTNALTREAAWEQKLFKAVEALQPFVPFDYAVVGMEKDGQPGRGYGYRRIGFDEYQIIGTEDFLRMSGLTIEKYAKLRAEVVYKAPLLLNGKDLEAFCRRSGLKRLVAGLFNLQSNLVLPLPLSRDGQFVLSLFSKHPDTYRPEHLELLSRLEGPLAVTLDKLLAYEEIEKLSERLKEENTYLLEEVRTNYNFEEIIGTSKALHEALAKLVQVAPTDATVLIGGETGTGKELVARAIHNLSGRRQKLLVKLNCACLPAQLIESELFGHERGAFTGAHDRRIGKFELAHGGTIFLDEIGEMPLELQVKLLRVLQEKEIERLGGKGSIRTDVRVIAATNRDLEKEVIAGRFRADLYFRLNVFPVTLPPLRERREDVPLLATHFLGKCNKKMGKHLAQISGAALQEMMTYHWPGNIRELEHVIEQSVITSPGKSLELARPLRLTKASIFPLEALGQSPLRSLADNEREHILRVLKLTDGRIRGAGGAAEILDIIPTTLEGRMHKLGIKKEHVFKKAK